MTYTIKHQNSNYQYKLTEQELQEYAFLHTVFVDAKGSGPLILTTQKIAYYTYYVFFQKLARHADILEINTPALLDICLKPLRIQYLKTQIEQSYTEDEKNFISQNEYGQVSLLRIKFKPILFTLQYLGAVEKYNQIMDYLNNRSLKSFPLMTFINYPWIHEIKKHIEMLQYDLKHTDPKNKLITTKLNKIIYEQKHQIELIKQELSNIKDHQIININYYNL